MCKHIHTILGILIFYTSPSINSIIHYSQITTIYSIGYSADDMYVWFSIIILYSIESTLCIIYTLYKFSTLHVIILIWMLHYCFIAIFGRLSSVDCLSC